MSINTLHKGNDYDENDNAAVAADDNDDDDDNNNNNNNNNENLSTVKLFVSGRKF